MVPHFIDLGHRDSAGLHGDADEGFVLVWVTLPCVGKETHPVSLETIGDPHLATIDDQVIRVCSGTQLYCIHVHVCVCVCVCVCLCVCVCVCVCFDITKVTHFSLARPQS